MLKKLVIVFASGIFLAVISLGAAWVIGGEELRQAINKESIHIVLDDDDDDRPRETREFAFDPDKVLEINMPVELRFERGEETSMSISAPTAVLDQIEVDGNVIDMRGEPLRQGVRIKIVAPSLAGLKLEAAGDVRLKELDQDSFTVSAAGAVDLDAQGRVDRLAIESWGAADLDFRDVEARDATVQLKGVGSADIAATGDVDVAIEGVGSVTLHAKPTRLVSQIDGVGTVKHSY